MSKCEHKRQLLGDTYFVWGEGREQPDVAITPVTCKDCKAELPDIVGKAFDNYWRNYDKDYRDEAWDEYRARFTNAVDGMSELRGERRPE